MNDRVARLRRQRDRYARYAELILAQLEALDAEDYDALLELADERDALAERIDGDGTGEDRAAGAGRVIRVGPQVDRDAEEESVDWLVSEMRMILETCQDRDERLRERLLQARGEARGAIRSFTERAPRIQESYGGSTERGAARLDIRL